MIYNIKKFLERLLGVIVVWIIFSVIFSGLVLLLNQWNSWGRTGYFIDEF